MTTGSNHRKLWGAADAYDRYMGRWSRRVAPLFLDWLQPTAGKTWADIGCGTGELSGQISHRWAPKHLVGIDTSEGFIAVAKERVPSGEFRVGDAMNTGLPEQGCDFAVSGLVLNFVPDKAKALSEMARIVRPGGAAALYVWDYAGHMQIMRSFFDVARQIDPGSSAYDDAINAPICRPEPLANAFTAAGLVDVQTAAIDVPAAFVDFDDYWTPFLGGMGSAPKYCMSVEEDVRVQIRDALRERLPTGPDGEILLAIRAWAVKGRVEHP
jgi:trans-aconitate methyltransferase